MAARAGRHLMLCAAALTSAMTLRVAPTCVPPTSVELLLAACKVARLPEVQVMPAPLRLPSTYGLVSAAFAELPRLREKAAAPASNADDPCAEWDALVEGLEAQLLRDVGGARGSLSAAQHASLVRAVVEVLFGDSLLTEMAWSYMEDEPDESKRSSCAPILSEQAST